MKNIWLTLKFLLLQFLPRKQWSGDAYDRQFKREVRKRYNGRCAITGDVSNLVVHHLNDASTYPQYRAAPWNGILIKRRIHDDFHRWMGGYQVSCTSKDFSNYLKERGY